MEQIITEYFVNDKNKDKVPFKTKKGEPFNKVTIRVAPDPKNPKEWDDKYISGLSFNASDACLQWKVGDVVNIAIEKNGEFWNFKTPSRLDLLESRVKILETFMGNGGKEPIKEPIKEDLPNLEEDEQIPF